MTLRTCSMREFQERWDNMAEPEEIDGGLEPCSDCKGECELPDGSDCPTCDAKGYFLGEEPITLAEFNKLCEGY